MTVLFRQFYFAFILIFVLLLFIFPAKFPSKKTSVLAAQTGEIVPNGDYAVAWDNVENSSCSGGYFCVLDEDHSSPDTSDKIYQSASSTNVDDYNMSTLSGVGSVTQVQVYAYAARSGSKNGTLNINIVINGTDQTSQDVTPGDNGSYSWVSATWSGLSFGQIDLDSLRIKLATKKSGGGGTETVYVATMYAVITYNLPVAISLTTDGSVDFDILSLDSTQDTTPSGINDVETVSVDSGGPADLDVKSTNFTEGANTWTLAASNGSNQVKWEFSKDASAWTTFLVADTLYTLDTNVPNSATRNLYLRITMPTASDSFNQYSSTVTIVASSP